MERLAATKTFSPKAIIPHLQAFFVNKLSLKEEDMSDSIEDMVRLNVARSLSVNPEQVHLADLPSKCGGVTEFMNKKILLFLALQKALEITFPPEEVAYLNTITKMADTICLLKNKS